MKPFIRDDFLLQSAAARDLIDRECCDPNATEKEIINSRRTRSLVLSKLEPHYQANVFLAKSVDEALALSLSVMTLAQSTHTRHSRYSTGQVKVGS